MYWVSDRSRRLAGGPGRFASTAEYGGDRPPQVNPDVLPPPVHNPDNAREGVTEATRSDRDAKRPRREATLSGAERHDRAQPKGN
jgi:hypothetical protein